MRATGPQPSPILAETDAAALADGQFRAPERLAIDANPRILTAPPRVCLLDRQAKDNPIVQLATAACATHSTSLPASSTCTWKPAWCKHLSDEPRLSPERRRESLSGSFAAWVGAHGTAMERCPSAALMASLRLLISKVRLTLHRLARAIPPPTFRTSPSLDCAPKTTRALRPLPVPCSVLAPSFRPRAPKSHQNLPGPVSSIRGRLPKVAVLSYGNLVARVRSQWTLPTATIEPTHCWFAGWCRQLLMNPAPAAICAWDLSGRRSSTHFSRRFASHVSACGFVATVHHLPLKLAAHAAVSVIATA